MGKLMTEEKVLKKLGIDDFRHLSKDKVIEMASMLDKMDPEVAKKALEQFPDFVGLTKDALVGYKETLDQGLKTNADSVKAYYSVCNAIIESLQKELEKDCNSVEERKYILDKMVEISDKMGEKDSENKNFLLKFASIATVGVVTAVGIAATILGAHTKIDK